MNYYEYDLLPQVRITLRAIVGWVLNPVKKLISVAVATVVKYMGVVFDNFTTSESHAGNVCKKWLQEL